MIISLRGAHGAGKSTLVRKIFSTYKHRPFYGALGARLPEAYEVAVTGVKVPLYVLGPYINECGGCDMVYQDAIMALVTKYGAKGHVLFEGAIVGCAYGAVGSFLEPWGKDCVFFVIEVTLEQSIAAVQQRRDGRGEKREFNPTNTKTKWTQLGYTIKRAERDGIFRVERSTREEAFPRLVSLLKGAKFHAAPKTVRRSSDILGG